MGPTIRVWNAATLTPAFGLYQCVVVVSTSHYFISMGGGTAVGRWDPIDFVVFFFFSKESYTTTPTLFLEESTHLLTFYNLPISGEMIYVSKPRYMKSSRKISSRLRFYRE